MQGEVYLFLCHVNRIPHKTILPAIRTARFIAGLESLNKKAVSGCDFSFDIFFVFFFLF